MIDTFSFVDSDRIQLIQAGHTQQQNETFYLLNLYALAGASTARRTFFRHLHNILDNMQNIIDLDRFIISGDFNYSHLRQSDVTTSTSQRWRSMLSQTFYNAMNTGDLQDFPTFQRKRGTDYSMPTIDYIYLRKDISIGLCDTDISPLPSIWSDHSVLSVHIRMGTSSTGPGLWRGNPTYASHSKLRTHLELRLQKLMTGWQADLTAQQKWEQVKETTRRNTSNEANTITQIPASPSSRLPDSDLAASSSADCNP
ncbi:hypothetical protein A0J61_10440 [Choanephora cucurbitarum]|uniref:Endonuclease/exonuclease/phosphatase domain-containing protein n=1 Tax=Choanephora cucurbitarum TaxID=101091 RepID=A0A1C7MXM3_9FUNG|nr:hypothetical protein A0J61_10440 [Choanephora cucurbitarum]